MRTTCSKIKFGKAQSLGTATGAPVSRNAQPVVTSSGSFGRLRLDTPAGKEDAYRLGQEFLQRFESRHGTILCRELIGCDISTPKGRQQAREKDAFTALCPLFVQNAAEIAQAMLAEKV